MLFPTYKIDEDFAHGRNTGDLVSMRIPKLFGFEKSGYSPKFDGGPKIPISEVISLLSGESSSKRL